MKIQQGSVFRVDMQNILGDKYIDMSSGQPTHEYILPMPPSSASRKAISAKSKTMPWAPQRKSENPQANRENSDNIDDAILNIGEAAKGLARRPG
ncbi:hypothetical protein HXS70_00025 [Akkermansia muciniphila]|uniref:hypothetical protein n=1 Tax=Akkermansia muciniphila TaxID=239935 RepID=UPI0016026CA3|nr:hypothetical protein [Akkermansia muciniphila]QNB42365.1 hypothetical protein HXS70_00025 [Akkermansia muciniphila]